MNISVRTINGEHKIAFENNKECTIRHPGPKSTVQAPVFSRSNLAMHLMILSHQVFTS